MKKFKYTSVMNRMVIPYMPETKGMGKTKEMKYIREYEKRIAAVIDNYLSENPDCTAWKFIVCDEEKVIPMYAMYDDCTLFAEALIGYSPYYDTVDFISSEGFQLHFLKEIDGINRKNTIR